MARDEAFYRIMGPDPQYLIISWVTSAVEEQRALMGEELLALQRRGQSPLSGGVDVVRVSAGLDALPGRLHELLLA